MVGRAQGIVNASVAETSILIALKEVCPLLGKHSLDPDVLDNSHLVLGKVIEMVGSIFRHVWRKLISWTYFKMDSGLDLALGWL